MSITFCLQQKTEKTKRFSPETFNNNAYVYKKLNFFKWILRKNREFKC